MSWDLPPGAACFVDANIFVSAVVASATDHRPLTTDGSSLLRLLLPRRIERLQLALDVAALDLELLELSGV